MYTSSFLQYKYCDYNKLVRYCSPTEIHAVQKLYILSLYRGWLQSKVELLLIRGKFYFRLLSPIPPGFPAPETTGAGGSRTTARPCVGAPLRAGPNGLGFQPAPCGLPLSAGSAPSAGPESSPFPQPPAGTSTEKG